ncbi:MAG: DUF1320 family protein [Paludibacteraceae bacterium]|nr:DUF1320 family protein [Paludibacteraceae bacterium]
MFLTEDDYKSVCDDYEFEQLQANTAIRLTAEKAAIEEIKSYTAHRYDMQAAFAAEGDDRNPMLVQCAVNITLWLMIHRLPQSMGHERRECLYNDSIKWLKDVQASKARPDLPTYTSESGDTDTANPVKYGSCERSNMTW